MAIKLTTGKIAFRIEFDNGDHDVIYFNPNDPDLGTRLIASKDKIQKKIEEISFDDFELSGNGEPIDAETIADTENLTDEQFSILAKNAEKIAGIINNTKQIIFDELDTAFDSQISSVVFKHCSPFAIVNGRYFIMEFIDAIIPEIKKHIEKSNADAEKRMGKHLRKYVK